MIQFEVRVKDEPGVLALVCEYLTSAGINIVSVSTEIKDKMGIIKLITSNETVTRKELKNSGLEFSERQIIAVELLDKPGELGRLAKALSDHNVNIQSVFLLDRNGDHVKLAIKTDNYGDTVKALEKLQDSSEE